MLNIIGWMSFFFTSLIALASALADYRKHGFQPRTFKYYTNLFVILSVCLGTALYPYEKISSDRDKAKMTLEISSINKKTAALQKQNQEITIQNEKLSWQNQLVKKQIQLTSSDLKKYKNQISQFSVIFSAHFEIRSPVNISLGTLSGFYMIPHVALSNEKNYNWVYLNSSPPNYSLSAPFINHNPSKESIYYSYNGVASLSNGTAPIGQKLDVLKEFNKFTIYIPMHTRIAADSYNSKDFRVNGCSLFFTINGVDLGKYRINCPETLVARIGEFAEARYKEDFLTVQFYLKNNLYELLNLKEF